jgi:uncharacterized SAM-binding protein YcdF (DUF218 family)
MRRAILLVSTLTAGAVAALLAYVSVEIDRQSSLEEARPSDVIVVLGAAKYGPRPSPVFKARLDHALELYEKKFAPRILTTGGAGGDPVHTEASVGRTYLVQKNVPSEAIIVEPFGYSTAYSTAAAAEIMRRMGLKSCIVVSDGYHIYRVKKMLEFRGLKVFGSPRPAGPGGGSREWWLYVRQSVGYLLWMIGIPV